MGTVTKQEKNVPKLRFEDFNGDWKSTLLSTVYKKITNGFVGTATPYYVKSLSSGVKYLQGKNVKNGRINNRELVYISHEFNQRYRKSQLKEGDLLMVQSGHVGECAVVNKKYAGANCHAVLILSPKEADIDSRFVKELFYAESGKRIVTKITTGNTVQHILASDIASTSVHLPQLPEQQRIADFLGSVDEWLDNLRQQKTALETYKRGMMQKLFTQQVRFKEDKGNDFPKWQEKKLGSVFSAVNGIGISKADIQKDGQYECVLYGELFTRYKEIITDVVSRTNSTEGLLSLSGDLLIPTSTTTTSIDLANVTAINKAGVKLAGGICVLRAKFPISANFYAYYLTHHKRIELAKYGQGVTIFHIYYSQFKKMKIDIPCIEEQEKIANLLMSIDATISAKTVEIKKVEQWKRGLMQKMFI